MVDKFSGNLLIKINKKGVKQFLAEYTNAKNKKIEIPVRPETTTFLYAESDFVDGLNVELTFKDGLLSKCEIPGKPATVSEDQANAKKNNIKKIKAHQENKTHQGKSQNYHSKATSDKAIHATAPYNFISYDESRIGLLKCPSEDELYSGTIRCSLECRTKTLVAGPSKKDTKDRRFLEIDGSPVIPGTSLKGMIRSLVEVMSFSAMDPVSSEHIFWRDVKSQEYKKYFNEGDANNKTIHGGYLKKVGASWYIEPVDVTELDPDTDTKYSNKGEVVKVVGKAPSATSENRYLFGKDRGPKIEINHSVVNDFMLQKEQSKAQTEVWDARQYKQKLEKEGVPVFFCNNISESGENSVFAIGLARYFRLPYEITPREIVSRPKPDDFVKNLFGQADSDNSLKGRVCFSFLQFKKYCYSKEPLQANLLKPHPSCLAHYLKQTGDKPLISYLKSKKPKLRGRKFYWHRNVDINFITDESKNNVITKLHTVEPKSQGEFCVHVERLNSVELGALLCALQLKPHLAHKLGSGKALGLGSVRIEIVSFDVKPILSQYSSLTERLKQFGQNTEKYDFKKDIEMHQNDFKQYVVKCLGEGSTSKHYDNLTEIQELNRILDFENKPANENTKTMPLNKKGGTPNFSDNCILPNINKVY